MADTTPAASSNGAGSILGALADHEADLLKKLEAAKAQAREIVDESKNTARGILQKAEAELIEEVAAIRRTAQEARDTAFNQTVGAAEEKLRGANDDALARVNTVAEEVAALFMPGSGGGNA